MFELLINQMEKAEGITEQLKEIDQLIWIAKINMVRERASEIVRNDLIQA